jgi:hypothetical protein
VSPPEARLNLFAPTPWRLRGGEPGELDIGTVPTPARGSIRRCTEPYPTVITDLADPTFELRGPRAPGDAKSTVAGSAAEFRLRSVDEAKKALEIRTKGCSWRTPDLRSTAPLRPTTEPPTRSR